MLCGKDAGRHAVIQSEALQQCAHLDLAWLQVSHTSEELLAMKKYISKSQTEADRLRDEIAHNKVGCGCMGQLVGSLEGCTCYQGRPLRPASWCSHGSAAEVLLGHNGVCS